MALALSTRVGLPTQRRGCGALRARAPAAAPPRHARSVVATAEPVPVRATPTDANAPTPIAGYAGGGRPLTPNKKKAEKAKASGAAPPKPVIPKALKCPCFSGAAYAECCGPYHKGGAVEPDAEAVLRARYSAYVKGDEAGAKYIVGSTHPRSRDLARKGEPGSSEAVLQLLTDTAATMKNVRFQVRWARRVRICSPPL